MQKPFSRGIFITMNGVDKVWFLFKYENLLSFCFECGRIGHALIDSVIISAIEKDKLIDNFPYSDALKAESPIFDKERKKFGF